MAKQTKFGMYLKKRGLNGTDVARELEVTRQYVSMLACGAARPGFKLASKIETWSKNQVSIRSWL